MEKAPENQFEKGEFLFVQFPGKKIMYQYVCVVQNILCKDETEIMSLRRVDKTNKLFKVDENVL